MPESKHRKTPERNRADVAAHRERLAEAVELIMEGLAIRVEDTPDGQRVTYDMDHHTEAALAAFTESQGITLEAFLRENIRRTVAKVQAMQRKAQRDQNAADRLRVETELARATAALNELREGKGK